MNALGSDFEPAMDAMVSAEINGLMGRFKPLICTRRERMQVNTMALFEQSYPGPIK